MKLFEEKLWVSIGFVLFLGVIILTFFISNNYAVNTEYSVAYRKNDGVKRSVLWIPCDSELDDPTFTLCDDRSVLSYFRSRPKYSNAGQSLQKVIINEFADCPIVPNQNGYITIRFIVNCEGKVGRLRPYELDKDYQPTAFPRITTKLVEFVKGLEDWEPGNYNDKPFDAFYYINCKVVDGIIKAVMP